MKITKIQLAKMIKELVKEQLNDQFDEPKENIDELVKQQTNQILENLKADMTSTSPNEDRGQKDAIEFAKKINNKIKIVDSYQHLPVVGLVIMRLDNLRYKLLNFIVKHLPDERHDMNDVPETDEEQYWNGWYYGVYNTLGRKIHRLINQNRNVYNQLSDELKPGRRNRVRI